MTKFSFVIPCYYSSETITATVAEIVEVMGTRNGNDYEVVLVNDGSKDQTFEVIKKIAKTNPKIKGINLTKNFGQANATLAGFAETSGDLVVYCDDDGQSPVGELWKLVDKIDEGYDVVFAKFKVKRNSAFQNFGSKINNLMARVLIGKPKHLHMGNFWVARKNIIDEMAKCTNPYPYIGGLFLRTTSNISDVATDHRERAAGRSNYTFFKLLSLWLNGFTAFSVLPLRVATVLGISCSTIGFIYIVVVVIEKFKYPAMPLGYSSMMSALLFIGGMIMMMLGVIGEYVGRIYMNMNKIPQYVVKEKIN